VQYKLYCMATTSTYTEWRYQMLNIYNLTSWGWAYYCSKHVQERNIMQIKKFCALSWYLVVAAITKNSLEWVGRVVRMDQARTVKKISESKPEGRRRTGKPRLRRMEDAGEDLRDMKVKRWGHKAVDWEEWASVMKEAIAVRRPYSPGVSKYPDTRRAPGVS